MKLLLATHNQHKIKEIKEMLKDLSIQFLTLADFLDQDEVIEDADTFLGNAYKKAQYFAFKYKIPTLADDSGLCVDALDGKPGVHSARYSGLGDASNNLKLLDVMKDITNRTAQFVAVLVLVFPDGKSFHSEGVVVGQIADALYGEKGFGYDPLFYVPTLKMTFAQVPSHIKHQYSHRGQAIRKLKEQFHEIVNYQ